MSQPFLRPPLTALVRLVPPILLATCSSNPDTLTISGTVEVRTVDLAPLAPGRLERLLKDEGDTVRAGDTVAVLVQPGLPALIRQRQAQRDAAVTRVAEVAAAEADSGRAANDLRRGEALRQSNVISPQQYDALQSAAAAATARLQAVRGARREADAARAALDVAQATLDQLVLIAPARGVVLVRYADAGEVLGAGMPVVQIGVTGEPWIRAYVGQAYIARVPPGAAVRIAVDGYPDTTFAATVTDVSPRAEFTPRSALTERERADLVFAIKVTPRDADGGGRLKAGMPVTLMLSLLP